MKKISDQILKRLNTQISLEEQASLFYLKLAAWCSDNDLENCKQFYMMQSDEERQHMLKIFNYVMDREAVPILPSIESKKIEIKNIINVFELALEAEEKVTESYYRLFELCLKEKDYMTLNLAQFFIDEQKEEETTAMDILSKSKLLKNVPDMLFKIDNEFMKLVDIRNSK